MKTSINLLILLVVFAFAVGVDAQTTEFTFQGSLKDGANPANGNYDLEFLLFDSLTAGTQQGSTLTRSAVAVANGTFSVKLDFGSQFPGANRFLEIHVRTAGGGAFTVLSPRQPVGSSPYAVQSLNAANAVNATTAANALSLGGVAASQYVLTTDPRMTDARTPTAGSVNYIQNGTSQQAAGNFNIGGDGTVAGTLKSANLQTTSNTGGVQIGTDGVTDAIKITSAGNDDYGAALRLSRPGTGGRDFEISVFGNADPASGPGYFAIRDLSAGADRFLIRPDGQVLVMGSSLIFPWTSFSTLVNSGITSQQNRLVLNFGVNSGNEFFISNHDIPGLLLQEDDTPFNSSFGSPARGFRFYSRVADRQAPLAEIMTLTGAGNLGLGTTAPATKLHVSGTGIIRARVNSDSNAGLALTLNDQPGWSVATANGGQFLVFNDAITQSAFSIDAASNVITINSLGSAGSTQLCRNASNQIATCSSSARYKSNIDAFGAGLSLVKQLRPVSFNWKEGGMLDMGLVAEEVAAVEPLLTTTNAKGEIEGVKYDRVSVVLINAVKEQQAQIEAQQKEIAERKAVEQRLQSQIDDLKKIVCSLKPNTDSCKEK